MELTKEYFDSQLKEQLKAQTQELKSYSREQTDELARIVSEGFERVEKLLNYKRQIKSFEMKFQKLEEVLHIKL